MNPVCNSPKDLSVYSEFTCLLDDSLTLIDSDPKLATLLGCTSSQLPATLLSVLCPDQVTYVRNKLSTQLTFKDDVEFTFSIDTPSKKPCWLLMRAQKRFDAAMNADILTGVLVDFTGLKKQYDRQAQLTAQYRIILEQTGEIMFDWDVQRDVITFSEGWKSKFGFIPQTDRFIEVITQSNNIHPEDAQKLLFQLNVMQNGSSFLDFEIRIAAEQSEWLWCKVRACGIYNTIGKLTQIIGLIVDIDDEKKKRHALQEQAEQDSLTKLLNAHTTRFMAEQYLISCSDHVNCAMLIIDLDDFKRINDQHGHLCGDQMLLRVANVLQDSFRSNDIVGRIGGEEFLVLMKNVVDRNKILERCSHLLEAIHASSTTYDLTASIGVCIVSGKTPQYDALFSKADAALYQAKRKGKNQYALSE